jgi:hypothetical protein
MNGSECAGVMVDARFAVMPLSVASNDVVAQCESLSRKAA